MAHGLVRFTPSLPMADLLDQKTARALLERHGWVLTSMWRRVRSSWFHLDAARVGVGVRGSSLLRSASIPLVSVACARVTSNYQLRATSIPLLIPATSDTFTFTAPVCSAAGTPATGWSRPPAPASACAAAVSGRKGHLAAALERRHPAARWRILPLAGARDAEVPFAQSQGAACGAVS